LKYLERYKKLVERNCFEFEKHDVHNIFVVIPAYKERHDVLLNTIDSLDDAAKKFNKKVSVLILVNWNEKDNLAIKIASKKLEDVLLETKMQYCSFIVVSKELSGKKSGVGMARKLLMDSAFLNMMNYETDGLIVNLDADTIVEPNYFIEIEKEFGQKPKMEAASISFSHLNDSNNIDPITAYELHLRYFVNMQRLLYLPFAFQTVGSAMVVRRNAYAKEGGMVKKQAGEDFYFLHKYTKNLTLFEINTTCVYPSSRGSDRVPFGTGKAVNVIKEMGVESYSTYNPKSFLVLNNWLNSLFESSQQSLIFDSAWFNTMDEYLRKFLKSVDAEVVLKEMVNNVNDFYAFKKRFFNWFDAFTLMKYLHFVRDLGYEDLPLDIACDYLFDRLNLKSTKSNIEKLKILRKFDLESQYRNAII